MREQEGLASARFVDGRHRVFLPTLPPFTPRLTLRIFPLDKT